MRSFLAVTGPKTDLWLVKSVGILIAVIGAALVVAGMNERVTLEDFAAGAWKPARIDRYRRYLCRSENDQQNLSSGCDS
jgi:hypothetical protein